MKALYLALAGGLLWLTAAAAEPNITAVSISGRIAGDNLTMAMKLQVADLPRGASLVLLQGDIAMLASTLPEGWVLQRDGQSFRVSNASESYWAKVSGVVELSFALRTELRDDWRRGALIVPILPVRTITVDGDRPDLEVAIGGARDVRREVLDKKRCRTTAFLGLGGEVSIGWKQAVRRLEAELMASCDVTTVANAAPGAIRFKSSISYRVAQGALSELVLAVPDIHVLEVTGRDIQEWRVDRTQTNAPRLRVTLARPQTDGYDVIIGYERAVPSFPCEIALPVLVPQQVIRAGGTLLLGTDSAIKIQTSQAGGLTQIDKSAFPSVSALAQPSRGLYTYQYATMPYSLTVGMDDIVTTFNAEVGILSRLSEGELSQTATIQLEVRDAAAREVRIQTDADTKWTVTAVTGAQVAENDVDVRQPTNGFREIVVPFRQPVEGTVLIQLRMEQPFAAERAALEVPRVWVAGARTQRGYVVAAAEKGLRLTPNTVTELRDVHTASTPVRTEGAQLAYRFREAPWKLTLGVERAKSAIHSEIFHLVSLGEGVTYVSAAITCHISGAPVQRLRFHVPARIAALDVVGAGIDTWSRSNDVCTVQLTSRTMGDFTLLLTYDQPLAYRGAELPVGEIETLETDSELGFIAVASSASLKLAPRDELPATLIHIARDEIPAGYAATITAPVIGAYKYVRRPHQAVLRVTPLDTQRLIGQVVDYLSLATTLGRDGESVTHALYCIKNANQQYLTLRLPPGAALWTVRRMDANNTAHDLTAQQAGDKLLIPVDRLRDPNQAVSIEITYAQPGGKLLQQTALLAPTLPDTAITFANWEITAKDCWLGALGGNMTQEKTDGPWLPMADKYGRHQTCRFYRTANLAGDAPLRVDVSMVPEWMAGGSPRILLYGGVAGLLLLGIAGWRRRPFWLALALVVLAIAGIQTVPGVAIVTQGCYLILPLALGVGLIRVMVGWIQRRKRRLEAEAQQGAELAPMEPEPPANKPGQTGSARLGLLMLMGVLGSGLISWVHGAEAVNLPRLKLDRLDLSMVAAPLDAHAERTASVKWRMAFSGGQAGRFQLFGADSVVTDFKGSSAKLGLETTPQGYVLRVEQAGQHVVEIQTSERVAEYNGYWRLALPVPDTLLNRFELTVPAVDLEILVPGAANLTIAPTGSVTIASGAIACSGQAAFAWKPRARDARREESVVSCDVDTLATIRSGVVDLAVRANYKVVQGEIRELRLGLPEGISVTAVQAPNLASWSLDPATHMLQAILARPASADFTLAIGMQVPCEGLPYQAVLGVPAVQGVQRQRGRLALAAPETILLRLQENAGALAINTADFADSARVVAQQTQEPVRRAFRYDDPAAVKVQVRAEAVQPEIRVVEAGSFSIGDERNVLSTTLELTVAKAGVFTVKLRLPEGYDIESLSGKDISHWDDSRRTGQGVEIFLNRRVLGSTTLNLVLARQLRGISERIDVPRVSVQDAARHNGRMAVSAERGVKLSVDEQQGVSVRKPDGDKVTPAALTFDILRPLWQLTLSTQVQAPVIKPEMLHRVELAEGLLQHRVHLRYRIENAGVKVFYVRVPVKEATLSVSGRNIARVSPLAPDAGETGRVWQVELHGKVEDAYALTCLYQEPYDPASGGVTIQPFEVLGASRQGSWLVVTGGGRVQVQARGALDGLKVEDARSLPDSFGAGDLSAAILCYRAMQPKYRLDLSVVRHSAAQVLPASVEAASLVTVISSSGKLLTQATLSLRVGDLRFLKIELPSTLSEVWSASVNGGEVAVARDNGTVSVPLEQLAAGALTTVAIVFADRLTDGLRGHVALQAPRFPGLPLRDIRWTLYVPPEYRYHLLKGDFDTVAAGEIRMFSKVDYETRNSAYNQGNLDLATRNLKSIDALLNSGQRVEAQKALQVAVNASQAEQTLNEDARVQFRNVVQQQVKMGLVNRREALRMDNNIFDEAAPQTQTGFNAGNFSQQFVTKVEEQLTQQDRKGLDLVAGKIVDQQAAAAGQATAIHVAMPTHGREMSFYRAMQSQLGGTLQLSFDVRRPPAALALLSFWPVLPGFLLLWGALRLAMGRGRARTSGHGVRF
jgi:hypothetical protein